MASYNRHIMIKDVEGFKANSAVMSTIAKFTGRDQYSPVRVLRGELVEPCAVNDLNFNYRLVHDHSVFMCVKEDDSAPLGKEEFLLLDAISKLSDRFTAFTNGALELGLALKQDSIVFVDMYGPGQVKKGQVKGTIMYKGEVSGFPGTYFGIQVSYALFFFPFFNCALCGQVVVFLVFLLVYNGNSSGTLFFTL